MPDRNFWRGRRVFLTGHTGFKGGWTSLWLHGLGSHVTGFALPPPTEPNLFDRARLSETLARDVRGDVRDLDALTGAMKEAEPEIIIHMAAQPLVRLSYDDPVTTYAVNVMGTVHLLEAVRRTPSVRAVVIVTTDKCYENREWIWGYRETDPMGGYDPYSNSKGCAELVTAAWRSSFFNPGHMSDQRVAVATARAGNVIGGGDWAADRLVPDMVRAFLADEPVRIRNPRNTRPWQHVLEPVLGYLILAEKLAGPGNVAFADAWNFGPNPDSEQPVAHLVERLAKRWGAGAKWIVEESEHQPHEANWLALDSAKARRLLDWKPHWSLDQALDSVVEWFQAFQRNDDLQAVTRQQIAAYAAALPVTDYPDAMS